MDKKDIAHLAQLSRIGITDSEAESLARDITHIVGYVSEINDITENLEKEKEVGAVHNIMREDIVSHETGEYTEDLLQCAPSRKEQYIEVKKILGDK